ncbi:MAG: HPr(Ser) kinase/phosphatase [Candidatus Marinimicrobia bacterium]|nr:HPr(Ser) kinase/phosphatase [Candidatus Neomarinimicrobiota bacterium]
MNLSVEKLYNDNKDLLKLKVINNTGKMDNKILSSRINRPGLELTGFWEYFQKERLPVFGMKESKYLATISQAKKKEVFTKLFSSGISCALFAHGTMPENFIIELADLFGIPLLYSETLTSEVIRILMDYLGWELAPRKIVHGTLVDVYGVGLLITGRSGIGKSEIALDLVERGHRLVSDDSVNLIRRADNVLIGTGRHLLEHHLEIRGIGIINIANMFGVRGIRKQKRIEVKINLEDWDENKTYERIGATETIEEILGVQIPLVNLPIFPGKNITVIAETIALNHMLKIYGKNAAQEFEKMLDQKIQEKRRKRIVENYLKEDYE